MTVTFLLLGLLGVAIAYFVEFYSAGWNSEKFSIRNNILSGLLAFGIFAIAVFIRNDTLKTLPFTNFLSVLYGFVIGMLLIWKK